MAYVTEGSEITFMHMAFTFIFIFMSRVAGPLKMPITLFRLLYNYPVNYNAEGRRRLYFIFISSRSSRANFLISMLNETMHTLFVLPDGYRTPPLSADGSTLAARARAPTMKLPATLNAPLLFPLHSRTYSIMNRRLYLLLGASGGGTGIGCASACTSWDRDRDPVISRSHILLPPLTDKGRTSSPKIG
jgi:hypothetical protein